MMNILRLHPSTRRFFAALPLLAAGCASTPPPRTAAGTRPARTATVESFSCSAGGNSVVFRCEAAYHDAEFRLGCRAAAGASAFALSVDADSVDLWRQAVDTMPARRYRFRHPEAFTPDKVQGLLHPPAAGTVLKAKDFWLQTYPLPAGDGAPPKLRLFLGSPMKRWTCTPAGAPQTGISLPPLSWTDKPVEGNASDLEKDLDAILQRNPDR